MPVDKQVLLRYKVLNRCFRNRFREFTIDNLVDACNEALRKADKQDVSKRTIQNDINTLEADYGIMLDEKLKRGRQRLYRYFFRLFSIAFFFSLANLRSTFFTSSSAGKSSGTTPRSNRIRRTAALLSICSCVIIVSLCKSLVCTFTLVSFPSLYSKVGLGKSNQLLARVSILRHQVAGIAGEEIVIYLFFSTFWNGYRFPDVRKMILNPLTNIFTRFFGLVNHFGEVLPLTVTEEFL